MKTKLAFAMMLFLFIQIGKAQCPLLFTNNLGCQQSIDISWQFEDCSTPANPCGSGGSTTIAFGSTFPIPCDPMCTPACNLIITLTAVNGCAITPQSIDWLTALGTPGGKAFIIINCAGASCGPCCDGGNSIGIDSNTSTGFAN